MKKFNQKRPYRRWDRNPVSNRPVEKDITKIDSAAILESFNKLTTKPRYGESPTQLVNRFKRMVENAGILGEVKKREHYKAPAVKKREKKAKAKKRFLRNKAKMERFDKDGE